MESVCGGEVAGGRGGGGVSIARAAQQVLRGKRHAPALRPHYARTPASSANSSYTWDMPAPHNTT